jgi:HK97 family phage prohead protease
MKFVIWDESVVDRDGDRILLSGLNLENFRKNPVMFFNHSRSWGDDSKVIGRFENLRIEGTQLIGEPVFDMNDVEAAEIARKVEENFLHACSIGFRTITSDDSLPYLPNQRRATITQAELLEISIVEIPAHQNAVRQKSYNIHSKAAKAENKMEEEIKALAENVKKLTETVEKLVEKSAEKPQEKTEEKTANVAELEEKIKALEAKIETSGINAKDLLAAIKSQGATGVNDDRSTWTVFDWKTKDAEGLEDLKKSDNEKYLTIVKKLK